MRCPFLREAQVKYCQASSFRKMIVRVPNDQSSERCSTADYVRCPSLKAHHEDHPLVDRCPFLQESLVQYCAASAVTKFIPYSEASIIRCGNDNHRYCESYLSVAAPENGANGKENGTLEAGIDGVPLPPWLAYTPNHCWIDETPDGTCHAGIDLFLTRLAGPFESVQFVQTRSTVFPTVLLTARGIELQVVVPMRMKVTAVNASLRSDCSKLTSFPYSLGWLFEGTMTEEGTLHSDGLLRGDAATQWMQQETQHLNDFFHNQILPAHNTVMPTMADGGTIHPDAMRQLTSADILKLFNEFCSPYAEWRK